MPAIFVRTEIVLLWSKTSGQNTIDLGNHTTKRDANTALATRNG